MPKRKGISLCKPLDLNVLQASLKETGYALVQPKLDGLHCIWTGKKLVSSYGNTFTCLPTLTRVLSTIAPDQPIEGELYNHDLTRTQLNSIIRRKRNVHDLEYMVEFWAFDHLLNKDLPYHHRLDSLINLASQAKRARSEHLILIPSTAIHHIDEVDKHCTTFCRMGYEGIVVKEPTMPWVDGKSKHAMKWKPWRTDVVTIIRPIRGKGKHSHSLGALLVRDADAREYSIGSFALTDEERLLLWLQNTSLCGRKCIIRYTNTSENHIPEAGVFLRLCNERT